MANEPLLEQLGKLAKAERELTAEVIESIAEVKRRRLYISEGCTSLYDYLTRRLGYSPASAQRRIEAARILEDVPELKDDLKSGELNLSQVSVIAQGFRQQQQQQARAQARKQPSPQPEPSQLSQQQQQFLPPQQPLSSSQQTQSAQPQQQSLQTALQAPLQVPSGSESQSQLQSQPSSETPVATKTTAELKRELLAQVKGQSVAEAQKTVAGALNLDVKQIEKRRTQKDGSERVETPSVKRMWRS